MTVAAVLLVLVGLGLLAALGLTEVRRQRRERAYMLGAPIPETWSPTSSGMPVRIDPWITFAFAVGAVVSVLTAALTGEGAVMVVAVAVAVGALAELRARARRQRLAHLRSQVADAMNSLASAMLAGSTFVRALQEVALHAHAPLAREIDRVLAEIDLGIPPSQAFEAVAERTGLVEVRWLSHVLRLQETTGSPIAGLLQRFADFIAQSEELQREVRTLTAEGRMGAYVIAAMPVFLVIMLEMTEPGYLSPFWEGWGLVISGAMIVSVATGLTIIRRMIATLEA